MFRAGTVYVQGAGTGGTPGGRNQTATALAVTAASGATALLRHTLSKSPFSSQHFITSGETVERGVCKSCGMEKLLCMAGDRR